jgi:hypothetical protein
VHPKSGSSDNSPATFLSFDKKGLMPLLIARSERLAGFRQTEEKVIWKGNGYCRRVISRGGCHDDFQRGDWSY